MKHAYCIIAYNNWELLERLITLLDDKRNDIYIHIDKNVKLDNLEHFKSIAHKSNIFFLNRIRCDWGTPGLLYIQLEFYKEAVKRGYEYYHLMSGVCMPLKTQDEIHNFFEANNGKEFVHFTSRPPVERRIYERYSLYHFFLKYIRGNNIFTSAALGVFAERISIFIQRLFKTDRLKDLQIPICYGSNWSSVTHGLACYVVDRLDKIYKYTKYTFAPDECVLQTLVYSSDFAKNLYNSDFDDNYTACQRYIDWHRGNPYTWTSDDYNELISSDCLFARKFDPVKDQEIIDRIYNELINKQKKGVSDIQ